MAVLAAAALALFVWASPNAEPAAPVEAAGPAPRGDLADPAPRSTSRPQIAKRLIPYGAKRQAQMAAYSKRHYGVSESRLADPQLIVIHYAEAGSLSSIYNTFAPNNPDVEYGELPGVCSHYAVGAKGQIQRFVPDGVRCRHVVGLNHVALGIEHVGFSDGDVLGRKPELRASLRLTQWLRCREGLGIKRVIGHNESLDSRFYLELDPRFRGRTHGDFPTSAMRVYRRELRELGPC